MVKKLGMQGNDDISLFQWFVKGIFTDSNHIFLWYESEDINDKSLFPKCQLIPILRFQVINAMIMCVSLLPQTTV